jgi:sugar phosphate isomerase/epimerase
MWSYVSHYQAGKMDVLQFLDTAKELGVDGVEVLFCFWKDKAVELPKVKQKAADLGLEIASFAIGNDLTHEDPEERKKQVQSIKDGVDTAVALGTTKVRVFAGHHDEVGFEKALGWIIEGLKEGAQYAETKGVDLCLENHGTLAGKGEQVKTIIDRVGSPAMKANPDTGNFLLVNENPVEAVGVVAPFTGNVHFKDFRTPEADETEHVYEGLNGARVIGTAIGEGAVDLPAVVKELRDAGYTGYLTIEYEGPEDPATALPRSVAYARSVAKGE